MSNTTKELIYLDENEWEVVRRKSLVKTRDCVEITGKTFTEKYVLENDLLNDFVLTRDMICSILQLSDQVVDTYVMPHLDIAYAEQEIRDNIGRNKIQVVVSKSSLLRFVEEYIDLVKDKQEIYLIPKIDYNDIDITDNTYSIEQKEMNKITAEVYESLKNRKYIQLFLDFATEYLENHIYRDIETNLTKDRDKVIKMVRESIQDDVLSGLQSYRSIAIANKFKHSMQARRYVNRTSHFVVKVKALEAHSEDKKSVIRFVMFPTICAYRDNNDDLQQESIINKDDINTKEFYSITVKTKTIEYLKSQNLDYSMEAMVLKSITNNMEKIFGAYKRYLEERKSKEK